MFRVFLLSFCLVGLSCMGDSSDTVVTSPPSYKSITVKQYKSIELSVNNDYQDSVGYMPWEDDEDIGVKAIFTDDGFIYITDVLHNNIKKISIATEEVITSTSISPHPTFESGIWLRDLAIFNDKVYVTSDMDNIYVFSKDLSYEGAIKCKRGSNSFYKIGNDSLLVYLGNEQLENSDVQYNLLLVNKEEQTSVLSEIVTVEYYQKSLSTPSLFDDEYKYFSEGDKHHIQTQYGTLELNEAIPAITNYSARNIHFTKNCLVYFNSTDSKLTLYIYQY